MRTNEKALQDFDRLTYGPMLALSLAIIPLLVIPLFWSLSPRVETLFFSLDWFIYGAFVLEYGIRFTLAPRKWAFVKKNKIDLLLIMLPLLRPLRLLRSTRALRILRAVRAVAFLARSAKAAQRILVRSKLHYALVVTVVVVLGAALLVHAAETGAPEGNIKSLPDGIWWAVTTVTTVGYGDRFPTTPLGRGIGIFLMVMGIALFGFIAGSLASVFLDRKDENKADTDSLDLSRRLDRIELLLLDVIQQRAKMQPVDSVVSSPSEFQISTDTVEKELAAVKMQVAT